MYICTECSEKYKKKPKYCSCGNDEFSFVAESEIVENYELPPVQQYVPEESNNKNDCNTCDDNRQVGFFEDLELGALPATGVDRSLRIGILVFHLWIPPFCRDTIIISKYMKKSKNNRSD